MSSTTESATPAVTEAVPVVTSGEEVRNPPVNDVQPSDAAPVSGDGEPSPKKAKVEEPSEPVKPGRKSRGSTGLSIAERTRREAEAILKDFKDTPDGGRRTRSATRGTPAPSPVQVSPRAPRKPREATPAVKATATEKKPSGGRGRGRPPTKNKAKAAEEVPAVEAAVAEEKTDGVDASNNGTETTSSDVAPSNTTEEDNKPPVPSENGVGGSEASPQTTADPEPVVPAETSKHPVIGEKKDEITDPWAAEAAEQPTKPVEVPSANASAASL